MADCLRRRAWKAHVALFVLVAAVSVPALVQSACASSWENHPAHRAVWKIIDGNRKFQASAFAVGPRLIVTVAHNLFDVVLKAGTDKLVLIQAGRDGHIEVAGARAISTTHDLALLETATAMQHHLTVAATLPHGLADQFHAAGYPKGRFDILSVITDALHGDADYYRLPMDRVVLGGISGAPILAPNGEVIGVQRRTDDNVAEATRFQVLQELLDGETGVRCGSMTHSRRVWRRPPNARSSSPKGGDLAAQYQLGREHRYIPGAPELRWLRRAAEQGHSGARTELGNCALFRGERSAEGLEVKSNYWFRLAAEEEDPVSLSSIFLSRISTEKGCRQNQAEGSRVAEPCSSQRLCGGRVQSRRKLSGRRGRPDGQGTRQVLAAPGGGARRRRCAEAAGRRGRELRPASGRRNESDSRQTVPLDLPESFASAFASPCGRTAERWSWVRTGSAFE